MNIHLHTCGLQIFTHVNTYIHLTYTNMYTYERLYVYIYIPQHILTYAHTHKYK